MKTIKSHNYCSSFFPVGWGTDQLSGFGEDRGTKHQVINLIHSIRTVMRSKLKASVLKLVKCENWMYLRQIINA